MVSGRLAVTLAALTSLWTGCRAAAPRGLDAGLAACVPTGTQVLAGVRLDRVRTDPGFQKAFAAWLPLLDRAGDAADVLLAYNGNDLLWAARGSFHQPPPGATLLSPQLAVAGPASAVRAAAAQHAAGKTGAPALVAQADPLAAQPIWAVIAGSAPLPLPGNAANLNRLLGLTEFTTLTIDANSGLSLHATGICRSADAARQLEETLRGMVTLARATTHDRALAGVLASFQIRRDAFQVHADLSAPPETLQQLFGALAR